MNPTPTALARGVFTLSLDFELIWGTHDLYGPERFRADCELERREIIERLLALFAELQISATWCAVGHLFLDRCQAEHGHKHPEIVRSEHGWFPHDWFVHDPCETEDDHSIFVGRSLIEKIRACPTPQEIGSHGFSHIVLGDAGCSRATAASELAACVRVAQEQGIELRSFAFPRNLVGHLDVLREYGFTCYRGPEPHWYERESWPSLVKRLASLSGVLLATKPPLVLPELTAVGLWNIPGSMIYFPPHGLRRYVPVSLRIKRAVKGLRAAARTRRVFHLWFHPTNLAIEMEAMFDGLRAILEEACTLRERNELDILPMGALVPAYKEAQEVEAMAGVGGLQPELPALVRCS